MRLEYELELKKIEQHVTALKCTPPNFERLKKEYLRLARLNYTQREMYALSLKTEGK